MFLKTPRFVSNRGSALSAPTCRRRQPSTGLCGLCVLYDALRLGEELVGAAKIVFGTHLSNNSASGAARLGTFLQGTQCRSSQSASSYSDALRGSSFTGIAVRTQFAQLTPANARRVRHIIAGCSDLIDKGPSRRIRQPAGGIRRPAHSFAFE